MAATPLDHPAKTAHSAASGADSLADLIKPAHSPADSFAKSSDSVAKTVHSADSRADSAKSTANSMDSRASGDSVAHFVNSSVDSADSLVDSMKPATPPTKPAAKPVIRGEKLRGADKMARIAIKIIPQTRSERLPKPPWIRASFTGAAAVADLKKMLRQQGMHTICEEAACPNLGECFSNGTATFLIMGDICTRRCPFCDVAHGRPNPLDATEPQRLAATVAMMRLKHVVVTSVDRDDLRDGGAAHFIACIQQLRRHCSSTRIEILTPDFRGRLDTALKILAQAPPDVFNHNLETVPRLYKSARPGSDYANSLLLLKRSKERCPQVPTKSGLMLGLGERRAEIITVMQDLRAHGVDMLTLGQYLQPSRHHLAVQRYWTPPEFTALGAAGAAMGFTNVASAPMVRSSYHADLQAHSAPTPTHNNKPA